MPLFSVVICTYNRSAQLDGALRSVLAQDICDDELLVVDDGSSDDTADVVAAFDSPHVRHVRRPNGGLSAARSSTDMFGGAPYILDRHHRQLARSPQVLADDHAVAAVSAFQVGAGQ
jgi:GT2 family glycosyltransferase